jgi:hypothetical protein
LRPLRWLGLLALLAGACAQDLEGARLQAPLDEPFFRCRVQPILAGSCAFFACHGDGARYFRVYARNRLRLGKDPLARNDALTDDERAANFAHAGAFVDAAAPDESLLLRKPVDTAAPAGAFHRGAELYGGGDVFPDTGARDFKTLAAWVHGEREDPACVEPGSEL